MSTALLTDQYEYTALKAALESGVAYEPAVFEVFARSLPENSSYGVFCGLERILESLTDFKFDERVLESLRRRSILNRALEDYLLIPEPPVTIQSYLEGDLYFPYSPVLRVEASFGVGLLFETLILSIINWDSAIASKASKMVAAANNGKTLIEMGSRRTHEMAAIAAARAAYIAGFSATSNLEAAEKYNIPSVGTSMHAFTMAHKTEDEAFRAQMKVLGTNTTLLVDTYNIRNGIDIAIKVSRSLGVDGPGAIRIDSGDLRIEAARARRQLDELGAYSTKIVVTGDLDEHRIKELSSCNFIDTFGVGTKLVNAATPGFVYKLVSIGGRNVAKYSASKTNVAGTKIPYRVYDDQGFMIAEKFRIFGEKHSPLDNVRELQQTVMLDGNVVLNPTIQIVRSRHERFVKELRTTTDDFTAEKEG